METKTRSHQEGKNPSPSPSPHNNNETNNNRGGGIGNGIVQIQTTQTPPLLSPLIPNPRSDSTPNSPYPTTFVQADTSTFKQVVQMLTGSSETTAKQQQQQQQQQATSSSSPSTQLNHHHHHRNFPIPPIKTFTPKRQQQGGSSSSNSFKLYERRNYNNIKNSLMINTLLPGYNNPHQLVSGFSPKGAEILSPSMLDFPRLNLSPVTPLTEDPFNRGSSPSLGSSSNSSLEEDRAIAEKGFYLHPSPRSNTPRDGEPPQLLPLFPVTSPRVSDHSSAS